MSITTLLQIYYNSISSVILLTLLFFHLLLHDDLSVAPHQ